MGKDKKTWFIVAISILLFFSGTNAESLSPTEFRIALKGSDGRSLENTNMPVEFRFFDSAEGGTLLWEVQAETTDGKEEDFVVAKAPIAGEVLATKAADASADRFWLEIEVGGDTLYPRQLLERLPASFQGYGQIYEAQIRIVSDRAPDPAALNLDANAIEAGKNISLGGNWLSGDGADEGVFVADSGYVGIGDDTPSSMLDVAGTVTADGGDSTEWNTAYDWGNHASQGYLTAESDPQVGANASGYVPKWNGSALVTGSIHDNNGNVGIGTTNATERLVLNNDSSSAVLRISAAANNNAAVDFYEGGSLKGNIWWDGMGETDFLGINYNAATLALNPNGGNVGVGTAEPGKTLDVDGDLGVSGNASVDGTLTLSTSPPGTPYYDVQATAGGTFSLVSLTSSKRFKEDVRDLAVSPDNVLGLRAVRYKLKDSGKEEVGLIAEEVDELVEELVGYDEEGKPLMVKYEKLSVYLLEVVKRQQKELVAMKRQIEQLRSDRGARRMKFPYGIFDFYKIATRNMFFIDRSDRIALLEETGDYLLLLRPRRFGNRLR